MRQQGDGTTANPGEIPPLNTGFKGWPGVVGAPHNAR